LDLISISFDVLNSERCKNNKEHFNFYKLYMPV
jgi:hypothetical protein